MLDRASCQLLRHSPGYDYDRPTNKATWRRWSLHTTPFASLCSSSGAGVYRIRANSVNTSTTWTNTVWYTITKNASNTIEIDWQAATTPSGNNGLLTFWVNGVQRDNKTGLRNGNRAVDTVQWGMVTGRDTGTSGAFYLDGFVSRRATYIGSQSTGQMAVGPVFDLAAKSYYRPVRLDGLKDRAAAGLAAPLADISGTVLVTTTIGYQYDGLGRLIAARYSDGRFFEYTYDSTGNRLSETKPTGSLTYTYDVANRLIAAGAQAYVWDAAGNLITDGAITYTYDSAQRLIGLQSPGSTSSYVYNGLGDRVQQSVNGATTNYALDLNTGLTQVLADNGTVYLYGADRLGEQQAGGWQYHHADGLGSLRALTNGSATVTLSKRYAPYGDVLDTAGTGASIFGFTGEQQDEGLVYLRARYYASGLGRFVSRDTWPGEHTRGLSLNRWTYVEANPITLVDHSGHSPCSALPGQDKADCEEVVAAALRFRRTQTDSTVWCTADMIRAGIPCNCGQTPNPLNPEVGGLNRTSSRKNFAKWFHFMLLITPGFAKTSDSASIEGLVTLALATEFSMDQINGDRTGKLIQSAGEAFARKAWTHVSGFYGYIGSRHSTYNRMVNTLYDWRSDDGKMVPDIDWEQASEDKGWGVSGRAIWASNTAIRDFSANFLSPAMQERYNALSPIGHAVVTRSDWHSINRNRPSDWGNIVADNPKWFKAWINRNAPLGTGPEQIYYVWPRNPGQNPTANNTEYFLTEAQYAKLGCNASNGCVGLVDPDGSRRPSFIPVYP